MTNHIFGFRYQHVLDIVCWQVQEIGHWISFWMGFIASLAWDGTDGRNALPSDTNGTSWISIYNVCMFCWTMFTMRKVDSGRVY